MGVEELAILDIFHGARIFALVLAGARSELALAVVALLRVMVPDSTSRTVHFPAHLTPGALDVHVLVAVLVILATVATGIVLA
eukprot:CAMPEP_0113584414 /NCGR_PEP_ID=MMETSP0015_2-20120614/33094_1 /TAXON_ID=2838 /ORGANISM="Odontella" /LENGTH=82 /DNA_ID=CAMNT_0000489469 /DNA_START=34 /DNA_END=279 /DNA_ORIENTATION=- /assembly_acc=CAM_ASM_000160